MKILWVTAQLVSYAAEELGLKPSPFGGWILSMINEIKKDPSYEIGIVISADVKEPKRFSSHDIAFYLYPTFGKNKGISDHDLEDVLADFQPDLIHIEGNEYEIHRQFAAQKKVKKLVSLQGILSGYEAYQYGNLQVADMIFSTKLHQIVPAWMMLLKKKTSFYKRLGTEEDTIKNADVIMGRTSWDRAHSYWVNPRAPYYSCPRNLRPPFFINEWKYNACEKHAIFIGNGYKPLKGLHFALKGLAYLLKDYPDTKLYVTGATPITKSRKSIRHYGYSMYISHLIDTLGLKDRVVFCGVMSGDEIVKRMCACQVFLLPSLIENSPNSLAEAMTLGMPCVSSYTGGVADMAEDKKEALLYRADDPELLAWNIKQFFDSRALCEQMGSAARKRAMAEHNGESNAQILKAVYQKMANEAKG